MNTETKVALIGAIATIIAAIIASPYLFNNADNGDHPIDGADHESIPTGPITVEASSYPRTISPGGSSQITVLALVNNQRLPDADVRIRIGGGYFEDTGTTTTTGRTDSSGVFRAIWHTYEASAYSGGGMSYQLEINIEKPGYEAGQAYPEIFIRSS